MQQDPTREPGPVRTAVLTACVLVAIACVWAVGLGIVDRLQLQPAPPFEASAGSRTVRRPVLFAVCPHRNAGLGVAIPIASIEPDGSFRRAVPDEASDEAQRNAESTFIATYCHTGATLRLLSGGAFAGTVSFGAPASLGSGAPSVRVASEEGASASSIVASAPDDLLAITDPRYGAAMSGARPMQDLHRTAAEQLTRVAVKARFPLWQLESATLERVRVADLDRTGEPELLVTSRVRLRGEGASKLTVALFVVGEPGASAAEPFRLAYVLGREVSEGDETTGFSFVDQANLTPANVDEIVVRDQRPEGAAHYIVLQRASGGWYQVFVSPPVVKQA